MSSHNGNSPNGVLGRTVLTTGQVADLVGVSPRTVLQWCNKGLLRHYRIPGSKDRRIHKTVLGEFLREYDLPFSVPASGALLVGHSRPPTGWAGIKVAVDGFAAGLMLAEWVPALIVVDAGGVGVTTALGLGQSVKDNGRWDKTRLVCVLPDDASEEHTEAAKQHGYDDVLRGEDGLRAARAMGDVR